MQYPTVGINPLLSSLRTGTAYRGPVVLGWDVRHSPRHVIPTQHLTRLATHPAVTSLRIVSDLLMEDWVISVHNPSGVTVDDVLTEIHRGLRMPLTPLEWECVSPMQRERIQETFYARCEASRDYDRARCGGLRRADYLLHTTMFAGLSSIMFRNNHWEVVVTLSRDFGARSRARGRLEA